MMTSACHAVLLANLLMSMAKLTCSDYHEQKCAGVGMDQVFQWFDWMGLAVFASSGTLAAWRKQMDGFGVLVLALVTAIGGGTIRDTILDVPVAWLHNDTTFYVIFGAAALTILLVRKRLTIPNNALQIADAIGLAFFVVMGCQKALDHGASNMVAIIMGTISGVCGGMIRDVLCREIPLVFRGELYAFTCIFGGLVYTQSLALQLPPLWSMSLGMLACLLLRLAAIRWHLTIPVFGRSGQISK